MYTMDERVVEYFKICTLRIGNRRHVINDLTPSQIEIIIPKTDLNVYFKYKNYYAINDTIIGGNKANNDDNNNGTVDDDNADDNNGASDDIADGSSKHIILVY